jgi:hypothetical protein
MQTQTHTTSSDPIASFVLTEHAQLRMSQRGIRLGDLADVLHLGRCRHARGTRYYFIGCKEVRRYARQGLDVRGLENLQVLLAPHSNDVITVYRNPRLPRG